MVQRTPSSALGPDGLCYTFGVAFSASLMCSLVVCARRFTARIHRSGSTRQWCLRTHACFGLTRFVVYRPLTLVNYCQKFIAKVFNHKLEVVTAATVSPPLHRGFSQCRSIIDHVLDVEASIAEYVLVRQRCRSRRLLARDRGGLPSASQAWLWPGLEAMGLRLALRWGSCFCIFAARCAFCELPAQRVIV